jgi:hypothetical protein
LSGLALVLLLVLVAGCSFEDARQRSVRVAVEEHVARLGRYDREGTHCTGNPRPWFVEREATVFICAVRLRSGGCDWFRATVDQVNVRIRLESRDAGCVLPG